MNVTDIERLASKVEGTRNVVVISKRGQFTAGIAWGRKSQRTNEEQTLPAFAARPPRKHEDGRAAWRVCTIRKMRRISPLPPSLPPSLSISLSLSLSLSSRFTRLLISSSPRLTFMPPPRPNGQADDEQKKHDFFHCDARLCSVRRQRHQLGHRRKKIRVHADDGRTDRRRTDGRAEPQTEGRKEGGEAIGGDKEIWTERETQTAAKKRKKSSVALLLLDRSRSQASSARGRAASSEEIGQPREIYSSVAPEVPMPTHHYTS